MTPGPAEYQVSKSLIMKNSPIVTFNRADTMPPVRMSTPGPSSYTRNDGFGSRSVSAAVFPKELRLKTKFEQRPGPVDYDADKSKTQKSTPKFTIGHEPRLYSAEGRSRPLTPSSQEYSPNHTVLLLKAPRTVFDKQQRPFIDSSSDGPGPGTYDTSTNVTDGPKVSP